MKKEKALRTLMPIFGMMIALLVSLMWTEEVFADEGFSFRTGNKCTIQMRTDSDGTIIHEPPVDWYTYLDIDDDEPYCLYVNCPYDGNKDTKIVNCTSSNTDVAPVSKIELAYTSGGVNYISERVDPEVLFDRHLVSCQAMYLYGIFLQMNRLGMH